MPLGLVRKSDSSVVREYGDEAPIDLGRRRLVSPGFAGWEDRDYRLLALVERSVTPGKIRTGIVNYTVRTDDIEKWWNETDPPPVSVEELRAVAIDALEAKRHAVVLEAAKDDPNAPQEVKDYWAAREPKQVAEPTVRTR